MPAKIARSAPRPPFGLPELLVAVHTSRLSCSKAGKARIFTSVREVIRGIPAHCNLPAALSIMRRLRAAIPAKGSKPVVKRHSESLTDNFR